MTSLQQTAMLGGAASAKVASYTLVAADAGTAISMSNASATTITVNTGLFAAGDTVFIQNIGAGACTITAGTATVATAGSLVLPQNDAGILYFTSTGAATFYDFIQAGAVSPLTTKGDLYGFSTLDARIPIGTNNQVLTADSTQALGLKWAAATGAAFSGASVHNSGTQSISTGTQTIATFDSEYFDTDAYHSTATNTGRMTIPTGKSGKYLLIGRVWFDVNATSYREMRINKNGSLFKIAKWNNNGSGIEVTCQISVIIDATAADYYELTVTQGSGSTIALLGTSSNTGCNQFDIYYLGA
jgi:hypothetical protein